MVCEGFFAGLPLYKASNSNAQLSSSQYTQPNGRGLREYEDFLLRENETFKGILPENGVIIDVGGGMGIAMRTLAEMTPIHAIVINTQDFSKMHERRTFQGSVDYRVGWAEDVLREIPDETADEVVDVYGGLTYSPHRIELIEQIYRTLKPGGTARLFFNPTKTPTWVKVPGEGKLNLHAYLEKELPGLVQLRRSRAPMSGGFVIEMRKPLSGKPKTINLPVELRSVRNIEWSIFTEVNYERKN